MARLTRALLALTLIVQFVGDLWEVAGIGHLPYPARLTALWDPSPLFAPPIAALLGVLFSACVVAWAARFRPGAAGLLASALLALEALEQSGLEPEGAVRHGKMLAGAILLATSLVYLRDGAPRDVQDAACGAAGACYSLAGISKLWSAGPFWFVHASLPLLMAERSIGAPEPLASLRHAFAVHPALAWGGGLASLVTELAGVSMLWPEYRRPYAVAVITMHVLIGIFLGYPYETWIVAMFALGVVGPYGEEPPPAPAVAPAKAS